MKKIIILGVVISVFSTTIGCKKFLDKKSDTQFAIPETLEDNQALLDRNDLVNDGSISGEVSSDDIYVTDVEFNNISYESDKRLHTWQSDYVSRPTGNDWEKCYRKINIVNTVLFNVIQYKIIGSENIKGQALVWRASVYLEAAQLWCLAYNKNTAMTDLGLPLRLDPDMNIPSIRSTVQQTYDQILRDLHTAVNLLPDKQVAVSRPSKVTALGLLARTYLYMGDYENGLKYGKQALGLYDKLMDFNTLNSSSSYPIIGMNVEMILPVTISYSPFLSSSTTKIPLTLYNSYAADDLRKTIFFRTNAVGQILFKGNYSGTSQRMIALAMDELYMIVSECYAELDGADNINNAMKTLNELLITRWKSGTFVPFAASNREDALQIIRAERRKELLFRGLRWPDLKRYNRDGANITLSRIIGGKIYTLPPNDLRYAIAIPEDIIKMTEMPQNKR